MATTTLDAFVAHPADTDPSVAISAAPSRRAFVAVCKSDGSDVTAPTGCTWGDQTMTEVVVAEGAIDVAVSLYELTEAQIAAKTGDAITPSGLAGSAGVSYVVCTWTVQDASQASLSANAAAIAEGFATSGGVSLSRVADSHTTGVTIHDVLNADYTGTDSPSVSGTFGTTNMSGAWGQEVGTAETVSYTWTHNSQRDNALVVVNVPPAGAAGPTIDDIDGDDVVEPGQTATINLDGDIGAITGEVELRTSDGSTVVAQTVTAWNNVP